MTGLSTDNACSPLSHQRVLIVGLGGLGCPAAIALAAAGVGELHICDDDIVDLTNLHRQVLFEPEDVGRHKIDAGLERLRKYGDTRLISHRTRLLPENARSLVADVDLVVEGADNFATKFLAADACHLESRPIVHGAAVRMVGTALSVAARGAPCYRCVFEDLLPPEDAPNCTGAGVMGPVVGVVGALMADLALDVLTGDQTRQGSLFSYDGKKNRLREVRVSGRKACPLCDRSASESIREISRELYGAAPRGPQNRAAINQAASS